MEDTQQEALSKELDGLFKYLKRVREEIAAVYKPQDEEHQIDKMGDQLDAITDATAEATNTIMEVAESNQDQVDVLRKEDTTEEERTAALQKIEDNSMAIFEACSFQDITGQRVTKILKSVKFVDERINSLVDVWGKEEVDKVDVDGLNKTEDEQLLNGPQLKKDAFDQNDIDALFD
ncbi:MAG: protein phosphatase CheZ [Alphaproteobacteria bacterium]|nr:protein phosphatase CheZ [Rhodospirillales bacterium]MCW9045134.1 protein phosphatase CheZ [Alphaproteobacteria bacterium]